MKKLISLALAIVLALALAVPVFADPVQGAAEANGSLNGANTNGSVVTYNVAGSYTVNVPAVLDATTGAEQSVSATNVMLFFGTKLTVTVTYSALSVTNDPGAGDDITYKIKTANDVVIESGGTILTVIAGQQNPSNDTVAIKAVLDSNKPEKYAGEYRDNITFTVTVANS